MAVFGNLDLYFLTTAMLLKSGSGRFDVLTQAIDIVLLEIERLARLDYPGSDKLLALGVPIEWMLPTDSARGG